MAKKRKVKKPKRVSLRPLVRGIRKSEKSVKALNKRLNLELKQLKKLERAALDICGGLWVFTKRL